MKKVFVGLTLLFFLVLSVLAVLLFWQPDSLKTYTTHKILDSVNARLPIHVDVKSVRGNVFGTVVFRQVVITWPKQGIEIAHMQALRVNLDMHALREKKLRFDELRFVSPVITLLIGKDGKFAMPTFPKSETKSAVVFSQALTWIVNGQLIIRNESLHPPTETRFMNVEAKALITPTDLSLKELNASLEEGSLGATGTIAFRPSAVRLKLETRDLPLHRLARIGKVPPAPLHANHSGTWSITWSQERRHIASRGRLEGAPLALQFTIAPQGSFQSEIDLSELPVRQTWRDPGLRSIDTFSAQLKVSGPSLKSMELDLKGRAQVKAIDKDKSLFHAAQLDVDLVKGVGLLKLRALAPKLTITGDGTLNLPKQYIDQKLDLSIDAIQEIARFFPALSPARGSLKGKGRLWGSLKDWKVDGQLDGSDLAWNDLRLSSAAVKVAGNTTLVTAEGDFKNLQLKAGIESPWDIPKGNFHVTKSSGVLVLPISLRATFRNDFQAEYQGPVDIQKGITRLGWNKIVLKPPKGPAWENDGPGLAVIQQGRIEANNLKLTAGSQSATVDRLLWTPAEILLQSRTHNLEIGPWVQLVQPDHDIAAKLTSEVQIHGLRSAPEGVIKLSLRDGHVQRWPFESLDTEITLRPPMAILESLTLVAASQTIKAEGRVPITALSKNSKEGGLYIEMRARDIDPVAFSAFSPGVRVEKGGKLNLDLDVTGSPREPSVRGTIVGQVPLIEVKAAGLILKEIQIDVVTNGPDLQIRTLRAKSGKGDIEITGGSRLPALDYQLKANPLQLKKRREFDAVTNVDLHFGGELTAPAITGRLDLKEGTYWRTPAKKPKKKPEEKPKEGEEKDGDEPEEAKKAPVSPIWRDTFLDVAAVWRDHVWYRDGLTGIETSGNIRLQKLEGDADFALSGTIAAERGSYDFYGREFNIEGGEIRFTGLPEINPFLNIQASYRADTATVYLSVGGTLKQLDLQLTSQPPLPENDILAILVFGRPLHEIENGTGASATDDNTRQEQLTAMAGSALTGYLTSSLRKAGVTYLPIDSLNIEPSDQGGRLTVGRYIGDRIFVSYGQQLGIQENTFNAEYYLTDRWTLAGQAGTRLNNYLDLLFRYPLNQRSVSVLGSHRTMLRDRPARGIFDERRRELPTTTTTR